MNLVESSDFNTEYISRVDNFCRNTMMMMISKKLYRITMSRLFVFFFRFMVFLLSCHNCFSLRSFFGSTVNQIKKLPKPHGVFGGFSLFTQQKFCTSAALAKIEMNKNKIRFWQSHKFCLICNRKCHSKKKLYFIECICMMCLRQAIRGIT